MRERSRDRSGAILSSGEGEGDLGGTPRSTDAAQVNPNQRVNLGPVSSVCVYYSLAPYKFGEERFVERTTGCARG